MTERAVLAVSFGTSHRDTLEKNIAAIEAELAAAFPERTVRRAFTSGMILRKLAGEGTHIDNVPQALERLLAEGCTDVVVQPTHVMNGEEYHKLLTQAEPYRARFARMSFGRPLLTAAEVVIAREIGSGVVPMDAGERAWRERHGRLLRRLAQQAGSVRRVFCGLTEVLK